MTSDNGQLSGLDQLKALLLKDITVDIYGEDVTFKVRIPDPAQFFKHMQVGNPILEALQDAMRIVSDNAQENKGQINFKAGGLLGELSPLIAKAVSDNETYNSLLDNINRTLDEAIVEPKLDGELTIEHIPITAKVKMISEMYGGGKLLGWLAIFRDGQAATVLTRSKGKTVRDAAK